MIRRLARCRERDADLRRWQERLLPCRITKKTVLPNGSTVSRINRLDWWGRVEKFRVVSLTPCRPV